MKKTTGIFYTVILILAFGIQPVKVQEPKTDNNFREQFNRHFNYASRVLSLAKAMPAENYNWRPGEEAMSIEEVYTHITRYNFYYLQNSLGISTPEDVDVVSIESITGKDKVVAILERSINHVKKAVNEMPDSKLSEPARLYGRTVNGQAVLMQLITHKSEHVGQSIAYARMNGVVPPWSK